MRFIQTLAVLRRVKATVLLVRLDNIQVGNAYNGGWWATAQETKKIFALTLLFMCES